MIAVAILAVSLTVLMTFSGRTLIVSGRAEQMTISTMLARQKMAEVELEFQKGLKKNEFPEERDDEGTFDEPYEEYRWKMELRKVELPAPVTGEKGSLEGMVGRQLTKEIAKAVRELKVTIFWDELGEEQTMEVVTHIINLKA